MKPEIKTKWIDALRSGKYLQIKGALRSRDGLGHCCLGVLCDLIDPAGWHLQAHHFENLMPGEKILSEAGLAMDAADKFADMNDDGTPFATIADHIERHL